jgi:protein-S-isoprenylcysteine O-methyltransferase Ste14
MYDVARPMLKVRLVEHLRRLHDMWSAMGLSIVAFSSFSWALRGHFDSRWPVPNRMRLLGLFSLLSYMLFLYLLFLRGLQVSLGTSAGLAGFVLSLVLFWWTVATTRRHRLCLAYTDAEPTSIYTTGPYSYIRHPFYLSYIIFWVSAALVIGGWQWMPAIVLTSWYISIAKREEERFLASVLSTDYAIFRHRTGMLIPRFGAARKGIDRDDAGNRLG